MEDLSSVHKKDALYEQGAEEFLKVAEQFRLGGLPTESPHPETLNLSNDAKNNVAHAISSIKGIDQEVFKKIHASLSHIKFLSTKVAETIAGGGNIFSAVVVQPEDFHSPWKRSGVTSMREILISKTELSVSWPAGTWP